MTRWRRSKTFTGPFRRLWSKQNPVLDLTNRAVRSAIGVRVEGLVSDDLSRSQQIAAWARRESYEGILAPSTALTGEVSLALFASAVDKATEEHSRVQPRPRLPPERGQGAPRGHEAPGPPPPEPARRRRRAALP